MRKTLFKIITSILFFLVITLSYFEAQDKTEITTTTNEIIYHGDLQQKKIYLTFDDGYSLKNTTLILETLRKHNVPAAFFLEGEFLNLHYHIINQMVNDGHIVGCHTWSHSDITKMSDTALSNEILKFEARFQQITGKTLYKYFRPPMGFINQRNIRLLNKLGYTIFKWNVDYYDYNRNYDKGVDYAYRQIISKVRPGSIILMHTLLDSNAKALDSIITKLKSEGYIFSSIHELAKKNSY